MDSIQFAWDQTICHSNQNAWTMCCAWHQRFALLVGTHPTRHLSPLEEPQYASMGFLTVFFAEDLELPSWIRCFMGDNFFFFLSWLHHPKISYPWRVRWWNRKICIWQGLFSLGESEQTDSTCFVHDDPTIQTCMVGYGCMIRKKKMHVSRIRYEYVLHFCHQSCIAKLDRFDHARIFCFLVPPETSLNKKLVFGFLYPRIDTKFRRTGIAPSKALKVGIEHGTPSALKNSPCHGPQSGTAKHGYPKASLLLGMASTTTNNKCSYE